MLPYFKSKLHSIYNKEREARLQASLWGPGEERFEDVDYFDEGEASIASRTSTGTEATMRTRLVKNIQKIIGACYPWVHATTEGGFRSKFSFCIPVFKNEGNLLNQSLFMDYHNLKWD